MQDSTLPPALEHAGLGLLIGAARRRMKQVIWCWLEPYGLTPQQFWILLVLRKSGPLSLHALAQAVWADDPTACRVVRTLADRGLLKSRPDPSHGRKLLISLDTKGRRLAPKLEALAKDFRSGLVSGLTPKDLESLRQGLGQVLQNLDRLEGRANPSESQSVESP